MSSKNNPLMKGEFTVTNKNTAEESHRYPIPISDGIVTYPYLDPNGMPGIMFNIAGTQNATLLIKYQLTGNEVALLEGSLELTEGIYCGFYNLTIKNSPVRFELLTSGDIDDIVPKENEKSISGTFEFCENP